MKALFIKLRQLWYGKNYCENNSINLHQQHQHMFAWDGGHDSCYLVPANAIHSWAKIGMRMRCHYCSVTVGPTT